MKPKKRAFWLFSLLVLLTLQNLFSLDFNSTEYRKYLPNLESFHLNIQQQSIKRDYAIFNGYYLISYESYKDLENKKPLFGHVVLYSGYIDDFIKISQFGGVSLYTKDNLRLSFPIRVYDNLYYYDREDRFYTICFLPYFSDCILLGIDYENSLF